jgi:tellurite resistance protein TerC
MYEIPFWVWVATLGLVVALLAVDLLLAVRRPHAVGLAEAAAWSGFYIGVAVAFGLGLWAVAGPEAAVEYYAGWGVEKSLSVDNLFVFVLIMAAFSVPPEHQQKTLLFGIGIALAMRAVFIAIGAAAIALFSPTFVVFGLVLLWTAVELIRHRNEDPDIEDNPLLRLARRFLPVSAEYRGGRLTTTEQGRRLVTPLFLVFVAIGSTDLLFALDSIPAVFGITQHPFIVFAANAFALLGLRALYFLVEGLLERLVYLPVGLAAILGFVGVKLILLFLHEDVSASVPQISTPVSLVVIAGVLLVTTVASLIQVRRHPELRAHAGAISMRARRAAGRRPPAQPQPETR